MLGTAQLGRLLPGFVDQGRDQRSLLGRHHRAPRGPRAGRRAFLAQIPQLRIHRGGLVFLPHPPQVLVDSYERTGQALRMAAQTDEVPTHAISGPP
ncbi:hypothetical protein [Streptomyces sp. NPDC001880]